MIGPSGAGKTTITKLIMKEENPSKGKIFLNRKEISHLPNRRIPKVRKEIGVVFQDFRLLEDRTVYQNIKFALDINGVSSKLAKKSIKEVLGLVGLEKRASSYPNQLSGGERQRAAMARAIVNRPSILIADEPTGNLDPDTSWEIMETFLDINSQGTTVIIVTHSDTIVNSLEKRVISLEDGKIISDVEKGRYSGTV